MASGGKRVKSKILSSDGLLHDLSGKLNAVKLFYKLAVPLLGSRAAVDNIIGPTKTDYDDVVFQCLYSWRNEKGASASQELLSIFCALQLNSAAELLRTKLVSNPRCLQDDSLLHALTGTINCKRDYYSLGLKLLNDNDARLQSIVGVDQPDYQEALYQVLISWRNQNGARQQNLDKLKEVLNQLWQTEAVAWIDEVEFGIKREFSVPVENHVALQEGAGGGTARSGNGPSRAVGECSRSMDQPNSLRSPDGPFYDVYLVYSAETADVIKVKNILQAAKLTVTTPDDSRMGVPVMDSIAEALKLCSQVVFVLSEKDASDNNMKQSMIYEMALKSGDNSPLYGRVICIFCCDPALFTLKFTFLPFGHINDCNLEDRLIKSIDLSIRERRMKGLEDAPSSSDDATPKPLRSDVPANH